MCVIIHKPSDKILFEKDIKLMWNQNPHGAGFAFYNKKGELMIKKGFMECKELIQDLENYKNHELVLHFRYATCGGISKKMTHPFSVSSNPLDFSLSDTILFHNGIVSGLGNNKESDSLQLARMLSKIPKSNREFWLSHISGRFVIMSQSGIKFIGNWDTYEGFKVSNTNFIPVAKDWHLYSNKKSKNKDWHSYSNLQKYMSNSKKCNKCDCSLIGFEVEKGLCIDCESKQSKIQKVCDICGSEQCYCIYRSSLELF